MALDILAFAAHRDDTEITCGGLLIKMVEKGYKVGACDLTQGEMGTLGSAAERRAECDEATRVMGLAARINCELPDSGLFNTREYQNRVVDVLRELEETRRILALWRCGDDSFFADVQHFQKTFEGTRFAETVVFNKKALRETIAARADFFSRWGITPASHPLQVLYAVEADETGARFGGYGYLFGYPDYAVNFFVAAAAEEEFTGRFVERGFYSIETFARPTNGFVWAVPKNHAETDADRAVRQKAAQIFTEYKKRRAEYIGEGKRGVVEMMRDWLL